MNTLMLIWFSVIEISNLVFVIKGDRTRKEWRRNKAVVNLAELISYILFTAFPGIDFSFRFRALLIILVVRVVVSSLLYLLGAYREEKNAGRTKSVVAMIISVIASMFLLTLLAMPAFIFADYHGLKPSGQYETSEANAILIDNSRFESFEEDGSHRELPIEIFYPKAQGDKFPLVVFSHGAFGYSKSNYSTYEELASRGFVVVSINHPYHAFYCKDSEGKIVTVNPEFMNKAFYINSTNITEHQIMDITSEWVKLRMDDMSFVIDTLKEYDGSDGFNDSWFLIDDEQNSVQIREALDMIDSDHIGVMGHSLGGATAEGIGRIRTDIDAVIDIDGTMLYEQKELTACEPYEFEGKVYEEKYVFDNTPYPVPILSLDNDEHHNSRVIAASIGMPYANNAVIGNAIEGYNTYIVGSGHMNYTDLPLFSPFLANMLGTGNVDSKECINTMNSIIADFFEYELKGSGEFIVEDSYECKSN